MPTADLTVARFPGLEAGYESYYVRAVAPGGGLGVWIRYTVHRRPGHPPTGSLWFTLFDAGAPGPIAAKVTLPGPEAGGGDWIRIGDGSAMRPGACRGAVGVPGGADVSWDLTFAGEALYAPLPRGWMYRAPLPRTKPVSVHPAARFSGRVVVDGRELVLEEWVGMVGHNWGTEHAERWIWLHGLGFGEAPDAWLDVVLGRLRLAGRTTPWTASGAIGLGGERLALGGPGRVRSTVVAELPDRLRFGLPGRGVRVEGTVAAPRERFVGWIYADPDGSTHDAVNCSIADLELTVTRDGRPPLTLTAPGLAAYELGMREHTHGMTIQAFPDP